jgi:hypothetical protein
MEANLPRPLLVLRIDGAAFSEGEAANLEFMIDSFLQVSPLSTYGGSG